MASSGTVPFWVRERPVPVGILFFDILQILSSWRRYDKTIFLSSGRPDDKKRIVVTAPLRQGNKLSSRRRHDKETLSSLAQATQLAGTSDPAGGHKRRSWWAQATQLAGTSDPTGGHMRPSWWAQAIQLVGTSDAAGGHKRPSQWAQAIQLVSTSDPAGGHKRPSQWASDPADW